MWSDIVSGNVAKIVFWHVNDKVIERHERGKKDKYLLKCHEQHTDFTPMIYYADSIVGWEAR